MQSEGLLMEYKVLIFGRFSTGGFEPAEKRQSFIAPGFIALIGGKEGVK